VWEMTSCCLHWWEWLCEHFFSSRAAGKALMVDPDKGSGSQSLGTATHFMGRNTLTCRKDEKKAVRVEKQCEWVGKNT
jgi:hypothetical protein